MFHTLFTDPVETGSWFAGGTARRRMMRTAASARTLGAITAVTVLALGALSGPAAAQIVRDHRDQTGTGTNAGGVGSTQPSATKPLRVSYVRLHCLRETDDGLFNNSDEPYLVVFAADLRGSTAQGRVLLSAVFSDMDTGETANYGGFSFWPLDGGAGSPIASDNDYIFLVALMESDKSSNRTLLRSKLPNYLIPRLQSYKQIGLSRKEMVLRLSQDLSLGLSDFQDRDDKDDRIAGIQELLWGSGGIGAAQRGYPSEMHPVFNPLGNGSGGGSYRVTFRLE